MDCMLCLFGACVFLFGCVSVVCIEFRVKCLAYVLLFVLCVGDCVWFSVCCLA